MKDYCSVVPGGARGPRARDGGPPSLTFFREGVSLRLDSFRSSFRRAAGTSTRVACAPQIAAQRSIPL